MSEDDPRHGTVAGYNRIPCREACCRRAIAAYKTIWSWDRERGRHRIISTLGTHRRVGALMALGWSQVAIARAAGITDTNMSRLLRAQTMTVAIAGRIAVAYEELQRRPPTGSAQVQARARNKAAAEGWPPPMAWLNIDDPNERPDPGYRPVRNRPAAEVAAEVDHLLGLGVSLHQIARQLGVTVKAIDKATERAGRVSAA